MNDSPDITSSPGDNTTLTEVLALYEAGGFSGVFSVTEDGLVECGTCGVKSLPETVPMHSLRRLEGASDPDDMLAVVAVTCPSCEVRGTITTMFGPMASAEEAEVLKTLQNHRDDTLAPPHSAPGETTSGPSPE
jgi:hypothetical protein